MSSFEPCVPSTLCAQAPETYRLFSVTCYTLQQSHHSVPSPASAHSEQTLTSQQSTEKLTAQLSNALVFSMFVGKLGHKTQQHWSSISSAHMTAQAYMPLLLLAVVTLLAQHDYSQLFQQSLKQKLS